MEELVTKAFVVGLVLTSIGLIIAFFSRNYYSRDERKYFMAHNAYLTALVFGVPLFLVTGGLLLVWSTQ